ncbi:hypothetical protein Pmani_026319 [Petrolisthes manimaculis]|uniref:Ubiquitin-like protease family profile domain-containing protein n=1 Tax=Petrolisthes manimaculis TaxID=1843537 RepID=A0AAE1P698_9EUCA|nr:hypothetical protein Pmani_026319 [Petrolisthes manimaculis]
MAQQKVCISNEAGFIPNTSRSFPFRIRKKKQKTFFYGRDKFSTKASFRYQDKMWYEQLLRQFTDTSALPSSSGMYGKSSRGSSSWNSRNIGPLGMISRSRCSSSWTQEKRQQMEMSLAPETSDTNSMDGSTPVFNIPKPPVKLDSDGPCKENRKPESESNAMEEQLSLKNSLEERLQGSPIYSLEWLKSLREKYEVKAKSSDCDGALLTETQRLLDEKRKKSQASLDQRMSLRMKHLDLTYPGQPEDEEEYEEEELIQLTQEMEDVIDNAFKKGSPNEVLVSKFNTQITRHDISTLAGLNWLNDEVVNFYMNLLMERGKNDNFPNVYAFNTFFYPKLVKTGFSSVRRWTRKVDLFSHDLLLIPIHLGVHWCMATIDLRNKCVRYYDSMLADNNKCLEALYNYMKEEHQDKKSSPLDMSEWTVENVKDIPQQMNGSDCGMFACMFAEYLSRDGPITFDQQHMPYFRRKMVYEIVKANLL